ncbi:uncharacterized protein TNCV_1902241 [Trichonephila clavipes]|nr:uncharacterized protein TNCV_1902241 [Trichonephila clavipes]
MDQYITRIVLQKPIINVGECHLYFNNHFILKFYRGLFFDRAILAIYRSTMPVVSDPCSCQPDCLVCGRGEEPAHDSAIHVLLESKVFRERMLHGEPTDESLEEILQRGKEYLPRAMTNHNSVRCQTMYHYVKSLQQYGNFSQR